MISQAGLLARSGGPGNSTVALPNTGHRKAWVARGVAQGVYTSVALEKTSSAGFLLSNLVGQGMKYRTRRPAMGAHATVILDHGQERTGQQGMVNSWNPGAVFVVDKSAVFSGHKFMHISKLKRPKVNGYVD